MEHATKWSRVRSATSITADVFELATTEFDRSESTTTLTSTHAGNVVVATAAWLSLRAY